MRRCAWLLAAVGFLASHAPADDEHAWLHDLGHPELRVRRAAERRLRREAPSWSVISSALEKADAHSARQLLAYVSRELRFAPSDRKEQWIRALLADEKSLRLFGRTIAGLSKHGGSPATAVARVAHMRLRKNREYVPAMAKRIDQHAALRLFDPDQAGRWIEWQRLRLSDDGTLADVYAAMTKGESPTSELLKAASRFDSKEKTLALQLFLAGRYTQEEAQRMATTIRKAPADLLSKEWAAILARLEWPRAFAQSMGRSAEERRKLESGLARVFWTVALLRAGQRDKLRADSERDDLDERFIRYLTATNDEQRAAAAAKLTVNHADFVALASVAGAHLDDLIAQMLRTRDATLRYQLMVWTSRFGPRSTAVLEHLAASPKDATSGSALLRLVKDDPQLQSESLEETLRDALSADSLERRAHAMEACRELRRFPRAIVDMLVVQSATHSAPAAFRVEFSNTIQHFLTLAPHACLPLLAHVYLAPARKGQGMRFTDSERREALNRILELDVNDPLSRQVMQRALVDSYDSHRLWSLKSYRLYVAEPGPGDVESISRLVSHSDPLTRHQAERLLTKWGR